MSKPSIVVYLASAPPFLLEFIYICVVNVLLVVLISFVREKNQEKSKQIHPTLTPIIHSPIKNKRTIVPKFKPKETKIYLTESETQNSVWSEEETPASFAQSISEAIRQKAREDFKQSLIKKRSIVPQVSANLSKVHFQNLLNELNLKEHSSYIQSMTHLWNKLFHKELRKVGEDSLTMDKSDSTVAIQGSQTNFDTFTESEIKMGEKESIYSMQTKQESEDEVLRRDHSNFDIILEEK